jgi:hypothetical protein
MTSNIPEYVLNQIKASIHKKSKFEYILSLKGFQSIKINSFVLFHQYKYSFEFISENLDSLSFHHERFYINNGIFGEKLYKMPQFLMDVLKKKHSFLFDYPKNISFESVPNSKARHTWNCLSPSKKIVYTISFQEFGEEFLDIFTFFISHLDRLFLENRKLGFIDWNNNFIAFDESQFTKIFFEFLEKYEKLSNSSNKGDTNDFKIITRSSSLGFEKAQKHRAQQVFNVFDIYSSALSDNNRNVESRLNKHLLKINSHLQKEQEHLGNTNRVAHKNELIIYGHRNRQKINSIMNKIDNTHLGSSFFNGKSRGRS